MDGIDRKRAKKRTGEDKRKKSTESNKYYNADINSNNRY